MNRDNLQFAKKQFKIRQSALHGIINGFPLGAGMSAEILNKMIAENIRGMDDETAQKEIIRLKTINGGLGFALPEKQRIQKLIYAKGRNDLNKPILGIAESINRLGQTLGPKSLKLPFSIKAYQFLIDISQDQVNNRFHASEVLIIDTQLNEYKVEHNINDLMNELDVEDSQMNSIINRIFNNNRMIVMYIDPHSPDTPQKLTQIHKVASLNTEMNDLKNKIIGKEPSKPLSAEDIKGIVEDAMKESVEIAREISDAINDIKELSDTKEEKNEGIKAIGDKVADVLEDEANKQNNIKVMDKLFDVGDKLEENMIAIDPKDLNIENEKVIEEAFKKIDDEDQEAMKDSLSKVNDKLKVELPKVVDKVAKKELKQPIQKELRVALVDIEKVKSIVNTVTFLFNTVFKDLTIDQFLHLPESIRDLKEVFKPSALKSKLSSDLKTMFDRIDTGAKHTKKNIGNIIIRLTKWIKLNNFGINLTSQGFSEKLITKPKRKKKKKKKKLLKKN